ncbi:MAG: hypothetical protein ACRCXT_08655 [Paraclostridium sp.]
MKRILLNKEQIKALRQIGLNLVDVNNLENFEIKECHSILFENVLDIAYSSKFKKATKEVLIDLYRSGKFGGAL